MNETIERDRFSLSPRIRALRGSAWCRQSLHHPISRTCAASAWPKAIGDDSPSRRPRPILSPHATEEDRAKLVRLPRDTIEADRDAS